MSSGTPDPTAQPGESEAKDLLFAKVFGVTKADLRDKGIDPEQYLREHIGQAIDNEETAHLLLPDSTILLRKSLRHGGRFYAALFAGLGSLLVSTVHVRAIHFLGLAAAVILWLVAVWHFVLQMRLHGQYKRACRAEGLQPKSLWGRPAPHWVRAPKGRSNCSDPRDCRRD
jgi:hypothetical protein